MGEREDPQAVYDQKEAERSAQRMERRTRLGHEEVEQSGTELADQRQERQARLGHVEAPKKKRGRPKKETTESEA